MKRIILFSQTVAFLLFSAFNLAAQSDVVASTSWTAAIAEAAGAAHVHVLAPFTLQHPPEYALKPSDLLAVRSASVVVYAGYERFAQKLVETVGGRNTKLIKIDTDNTPQTIESQAKIIATQLGTLPKYEAWLKRFTAFTAQSKARVRRAFGNRPVVVQKFMVTYARWLGLNVVGDFGPTDPSPAVVARLAGLKPAVVIDNYHTPNGKPIAEASGAAYVQLINFPGRDHTRSIEDVFRFNENLLISAVSH